MINVSIVGGTGYVAAELLRLINLHPFANVKMIMSSSNAGTNVSNVYRHLNKIINMRYESIDYDLIEDSDIVFCALPHGVSQEIVAYIYQKGKKVIDLSADYRYNSISRYIEWYGEHKYPELLKKSVYGLTELYREKIKDAEIVGNPGCYTTCSILALAPLLKNKIVSPKNIIIDAKSGVSGAGRKAEYDYSFCEVEGNFKAYNVAKHRHTSEIEQEYSLLFGQEIVVNFTPHLLPTKRGILCTIYSKLIKDMAQSELIDIYKEFYKNDFFIRIYDDSLPEIKYVTGTNFVDIGLVKDKRTNNVIIVACIDNLIKGAAGQAIQNMNVMFGLDEKTGLNMSGEYF